MKMPNAGLNIRGFAVTDGEFGPVKLDLTPSGIAKVIGTKAFTMMNRYIYSMPIVVVYRDSVGSDAQSSIYGDEQVKGAVLLLGGTAEDIHSLSDFEVMTIRSCANMMKLGGDNRLLIGNVTKKPKATPIQVVEE